MFGSSDPRWDEGPRDRYDADPRGARVAVAQVQLEQLTTAVSEHNAPVALVQRHGFDEAFVAQVVQTVGARVDAVVAQVTLGDDAERADGREVPAVLAVQGIGLIMIPDDFPLEP